VQPVCLDRTAHRQNLMAATVGAVPYLSVAMLCALVAWGGFLLYLVHCVLLSPDCELSVLHSVCSWGSWLGILSCLCGLPCFRQAFSHIPSSLGSLASWDTAVDETPARHGVQDYGCGDEGAADTTGFKGWPWLEGMSQVTSCVRPLAHDGGFGVVLCARVV
jgi:hypothetical protein